MIWANGTTKKMAKGYMAILTNSGESVRTRKDYSCAASARERGLVMAKRLGWSIVWGRS
jgi:hypothetical protein